jgi:hypothetical protein
MRAPAAENAAFYCVADSRYFLGAVGMINSLRLQGHLEPVYVLDLGLTEGQRELLGSEATIVAAPPHTPPWLAKTIAPLAHPTETMVLIDTDVIVTRTLGELLDVAAGERGRVVAFENDVQRFVPEWGELLDLAPVRAGPYVSSGLVALGGKTGAEVLRLLDDRQRRVEFDRTFWRGNDPEYPFLYADQDVLNAILASTIAPERVRALSHRLAATTPFGGLEAVDEATLRCAYPDGSEPYVVHFLLPGKPWQRPMYHGVYSRLLKRLLVGPDLAIALPENQVPVRFRDGARATLARARTHARDRLGWRVRSLVPDALLERLDEARRRRAVTPR